MRKRFGPDSSHGADCRLIVVSIYLISKSLTSKTKVLFAGIPGCPLLPYARWAGIVSLRSPPTAMPATPMSHPLMTSPAPSLKLNGLPDLLAKYC